MSTFTPKLSIIITFHNENCYAQQTLNNIILSTSSLEKKGASVEFIVLLDCASALTKTIAFAFAQACRNVTVIETDYGDVSDARNHGVSASESATIAICDGDDYYSTSWFRDAYELHLSRGADSIIHPEYFVSFQEAHLFTRHVDPESAQFNAKGLLSSNYWGPWIITSKAVLTACAYTRLAPRKETGYCAEDWHWNCETVARGFKHLLCPRTVVFYRRRSTGLSAWVETQGNRHKIAPTSLFTSQYF